MKKIPAIQLEQDEYLDSDYYPYRKLWMVNLLHGIQQAMSGETKEIAWTFSEQWHVGSFSWICEHLDIDKNALRERILKNPTYLENASISHIISSGLTEDKKRMKASKYNTGKAPPKKKRFLLKTAINKIGHDV